MPSSYIGQQIAACRRARGWSQKTLADLVGIARSYVGHIETGIRPLDDRLLLARFAEVLGVSVAHLTGQPYDHGDPVLDAVRLAVPRIERAIMAAGAGAVGDPPPLADLEATADHLLALRMDTDFAAIGPVLPGLITGLYQHGVDGPDTGRRRAWVGLAKAEVCAALILKGMGYPSLAWLAAGDACKAAGRAEDPTARAAAEFAAAQSLLSAGVTARSLLQATDAVERLSDSLAEAEGQQMLGMLHLHAALTSATLGRSQDAASHQAEARALAARTGEGNAWALRFGPINTAVWGVGVALEQRDTGRVRELARAVDAAAVPTAERKARFLLDVGRAEATQKRYDDALRLLLRAEQAAPAYVRSRPAVRELVGFMLRESQRSLASGHLGKLASRVGAAA